MPQILSSKALNRATLARQMLLQREATTPLDALARLTGMQAQAAKPPYLGLWTRLAAFSRLELRNLLQRREVVRATAMRGTLHLLTLSDYAQLRSALQPMLSGAMRATLRQRAETLDVTVLVDAARSFFEESPRTFTALRAHLMERYPDGDERAMGFAVRTHLPLVMVPDDSPWGYPADSAFAVAEQWIGGPLGEDERPLELVRRYLASFGPATVADAQTWSGLKGLKATFEALKSELMTFRDERGCELFDLPEAPRPDEDTTAPVRFLPEYDNLVLAHSERGRIIADAYRSRIVTANLKVLATFLVDGKVAGTWKTERKGKAATLIIEPFEALASSVREALAEEGLGALRFSEEEAQSFDLKIVTP